jgi:hypothetical protein
VLVLSKLLAGRGYAINSDRPAFVSRMRALAERIGASDAKKRSHTAIE